MGQNKVKYTFTKNKPEFDVGTYVEIKYDKKKFGKVVKIDLICHRDITNKKTKSWYTYYITDIKTGLTWTYDEDKLQPMSVIDKIGVL